MYLNEKIFFSSLNNLRCFEAKPRFCVGVSGGPDSMALAYLLNKWVKIKQGKLTALIFDHCMRKNSKEESYIVSNVLKKMKISNIIIRANKNSVIKKNMAQARDNRFNGIINYCKKTNIPHLFLGHHFDDNLETYLIRKINGSNIEGLASMNFISYFKNLQILRPLIEFKKEEILYFNKINNINFINDPSNQAINYTRVKVRYFLKETKNKNLIKRDLNNIKKLIPNYKKMIWELLINSLTNISANKININLNKFLNNDDIILERHTLIILKYFSNIKYKTRSAKIKIFIDEVKKSKFKSFNLSGIIIKKSNDLLTFSEK